VDCPQSRIVPRYERAISFGTVRIGGGPKNAGLFIHDGKRRNGGLVHIFLRRSRDVWGIHPTILNGSKDKSVELEDLAGDDLFEVVQHENAPLAVFDILSILRYRFHLDERRTMPRTERTSGQAPNSALISGCSAIEVRVNEMRADDQPGRIAGALLIYDHACDALSASCKASMIESPSTLVNFVSLPGCGPQ
jgi:hypothetical protein